MIVSYASESTLLACLSALPVEALHGVVVVDNDSPDRSADVARGVAGVEVVCQENRGFGSGCNTGARHLPGAELLLFLNPDAVVTPSMLTDLVSYLDESSRCALVGPRLRRGEIALTSAGRQATVRTELRALVPTFMSGWLPDRRFLPSFDRTGPAGYVEGACFLVRAEAWCQAGRFDERFFLFFEELDLAWRLNDRGWTVDLLATSWAEHQSAVSRRQLSDGGRYQLLRSTVLFLFKTRPVKARCFVLAARLFIAMRARGGLDPAVARNWSAALADGLQSARHMPRQR